MHLSHLKTHGFSCSTLGSFDVGGISSDTWVKRDMIDRHYYWQKHPMLFRDDIHIHGCIDETFLRHLKSSCFIFSLFGSYFGGGSSFTSWMKKKSLIIILMHITFFRSRIIGHGILTYVIGADLIGHLKHVCTWKMVVYSLGGIRTFMIF